MSTRFALLLAIALAVPALAQNTAEPENLRHSEKTRDRDPAGEAWIPHPQNRHRRHPRPCSGSGAPAAGPAAGAPALDSQKAKVSYVIGTRIGANIKRDQLDLDLDALVAGLRDAAAGQASRVSAADGDAAMAALEKGLQAKQEKASAGMAEKNPCRRRVSRSNRKREGVTTTPSGLQYEVLNKATVRRRSATKMSRFITTAR